MTEPFDPRLPRLAVPSAYRLELAPDIEDHSFTGQVEIDIDVLEPTRHLVCNSIELTIHEATLSQGGSSRSLSFDLDEETERLLLSSGEMIPSGPSTLTLSFSGILNDKLRGFYRSTFTDDNGIEHTIATTQFQSTDARRCFPCWDEPEYKATFQTTLTVEADHLAITNTGALLETELPDGKRRIEYAPTMAMSTYLVAFVVGPLEATEPVDAGGVPVRVIHRPGLGERTTFALDVAVHALKWFSDYYAIPYPSDKVDLVAIPDFAFGAMENLGCVTFREVLLIIDPTDASQPELQRAADVINHELAHMWFGDLVTMKWWEGIWLNEAFATFMEVSCSDAYRPDWRVWDSFARARSAAFDVDALASTRPIEFPVVTPQDAEGMFDLLTYEKGASVVRMLEQYLSQDVFRQGVRHYLNAHAYGNTETTDLWASLETVSGEPVQALMHQWIYQGGHPIVTAIETPGGLEVKQQRFTLDPEAAGDETWSVPLVIRGEGGTKRALLTETTQLLSEVDTAPTTINAGAAGFYRTAVDAATIDRIEDAGLGDRSPTERHGLVDDAWSLSIAGQLPAHQFIRLVEAFTGEPDLNVWQALADALHGLHRIVDDEAQPYFESLVRNIARPTLDQISIEPGNDDDRTRELRATLVRLLGTASGDPDVIEHARRSLSHPDPSLAAAALSVFAHHGGTVEYDRIEGEWHSAPDPVTEIRYLRALAGFRSIEMIDRLLESISSGEVRTQDAPYLLARAMHSPEVGRHVWGYVTEQWDALNERFPSNSIPRMLSGITSLDETDLVSEVGSFLESHPVTQAGRQVDQHRERQRINAAFRVRESDRFSKFLIS